MTNHHTLSVNGSPVHGASREVTGAIVRHNGRAYYEIDQVHHMAPFLLTISGSANHWMYLSSAGGLTCGRRSPDHALFPYYTDDKIHDAVHTTGPLTVLRLACDGEGGRQLWMPFSPRYSDLYEVSRRIRKRLTGDEVVYEEHNHTLQLVFRYSWRFSPAFGFVRTVELENRGERACTGEVLDGLRNLLPAGVDRATQHRASTLVDAYKLSELQAETGLAVYSMSSLITDRAEPSEALRATVAWRVGLEEGTALLSESQVERFIHTGTVEPESAVRGRRGAFLLAAPMSLPAGKTAEWMIVADTDRDSAGVADLDRFLATTATPAARRARVLSDAEAGETKLARLVATADGLQLTGDQQAAARHYSNVLFNIMRGGVFAEGYTVHRDDLRAFLTTRNRTVAERHTAVLSALPERENYTTVLAALRTPGDPQLERLSLEYLPLMFSRRHGDPSRPWNRFSIEIENPDGSTRLFWQGNWRDIFQNWEALGISYPRFAPAMIATFLNASTADGYNPYRVSRDGLDWEVHDPEDPWSNIGYWGDHQVVYLWRLLELADRHDPNQLPQWIDRALFSSAAVPYRIREFEHIVENPYESVDYDEDAATAVAQRVAAVGADGRLIHDNEEPVLVTLLEKLMVMVLVKLSNYVPDGGIWMNTQRPEWNDANNALAGWGLSMVTLMYLRGFLDYFDALLSRGEATSREVHISGGVADLLNQISAGFSTIARGEGPVTAENRWDVMRALGRAGSEHRRVVYSLGVVSRHVAVPIAEIRSMLQPVKAELDATIATNRRDDGLYHSYNVLQLEDSRALVDRLPVMLEGQVAIMGSRLLSASQAAELMDHLRNSALYRADARSYTLYPDKQLPSFLEKNTVGPELLRRSPWLQREADRSDGRVVRRDAGGTVRFNAAFRNARDLSQTLTTLRENGQEGAPSRADETAVLAIYEAVFNHKSFTGRSGTFFKYEGLGSIYWHMVSKLGLAVLEALQLGDEALRGWYRQIREGIGAHKPPTEYGAFPFDPYSHTPSFMGAQQPGMTGQVKEDIIARFAELGVVVKDGQVSFRPRAVDAQEFLTDSAEFSYLDTQEKWRTLTVPAGALAFTYAQTPVLYRSGDRESITVVAADGTEHRTEGATLTVHQSRSLFDRRGTIARIEVTVPVR